MATASVETKKIPLTTWKEEKIVDLTLSIEEAETLATILRFIGGNPKETRREHADSISRALRDANVSFDISDVSQHIGRGIVFR